MPLDTVRTIWLFGRPCSGKSTISAQLQRSLEKRGIKTVALDGDALRRGLNADIGFSGAHRIENLRRAAHVARLFNENGLPVIASFVSPSNESRRNIRNILGRAVLVYLRCSPEECEKRDVKGQYRLARSGEIKDFTGVSSSFEEPKDADITVDTEKEGVERCVAAILRHLENA